MDAGVWITPDPIGILGGLNLYQYAQNDPVNRIDFLGLTKCEIKDKGSYTFKKYPGDKYHGGPHIHVYDRRTGKLLGRVSLPDGKVLTGSVPKTAIKGLTALGKIVAPAVAIVLEAFTPAEAHAPVIRENQYPGISSEVGLEGDRSPGKGSPGYGGGSAGFGPGL